jgi:hypothetical protein
MRALFNIVIGMCGFVAAGLLIHRILPRELPYMVREKLAHLAAHGSEYDALFLGSSRVATHVIPTIFDHVAGERGVAIKSFNAGIPGMFTPQDDYMLERILASKPARVRWIFLEVQSLQTALPPAARDTVEAIYWHDWPRFALVCRRLTGKGKRRSWRDQMREAVERLPNLGEHAVLFAKRFTNLGRGALLLDRWIRHEPEPPMDWRVLGENGDGWIHPDDARQPNAKAMAALSDDLEKLRRSPPVREDRDPATQKALDTMVSRIRRSGATPVLIIPPNAGRGSYFYPSPQSAGRIMIFDFCDPRKYPELYELKNRLGGAHLNTAGAEIFTRLLAQRFVEIDPAHGLVPRAR